MSDEPQAQLSQRSEQKQEIFFKLIEKVGAMGKYQQSLFLTLSTISLLTGGMLLMTPFLFYQDNYQCNNGLSTRDCLEYVCSLPTGDRQKFIPQPSIISFANRFGDYRCPEDQQGLDLIKSFFYFGQLCGFFFSSLVGDHIRAKFLMVGGMIVGIFGILIVTFTHILWLGVIGLLLIPFGLVVSYNLTYIFITEMVEQARRQQYKIVVSSLFSMGALVNVLWFFMVPNFDKVIIIFYGIPMAIIAVVFFLFFKDTPISLITKNTPEKAFKHLMDIAKMNGIRNPDLTVEQIREFQKNYEKNFVRMKDNKAQKFSMLDLFRYKSLRSMTIMLIIVDCVFTLQYFTPTLMLSQFNFDIFLSGAGIQSAQIFAGVFGYFMISRLLRRKVGEVSFLIIMACSIVLIFIWDQDQEEVTDIKQNIAVLFFIFFIELTVSNAFNFYAVYLNELYPTQIRVIGVGFVKIWGSVTIMMSSQIIDACLNSGFKIMILFALLAAGSVVLAYALPQTFGKRPPEIIEELIPSQTRTTELKQDYQDMVQEIVN